MAENTNPGSDPLASLANIDVDALDASLQQTVDNLLGLPDKPNRVSTQSVKQMMTGAQTGSLNVRLDPFYSGKRVMGNFQNPDFPGQYFDRYKNHPDFDKLGFTPFRDNEALYNEHTNFFKEMRRMTPQLFALSRIGFVDTLDSWFTEVNDIGASKAYRTATAIGSSSVGGVTGFTNNLMLNSGYTLGIISEMVAEEGVMSLVRLGLTALSPYTGGASAGAAVGVTAASAVRRTGQLAKLRKVWSAAKNLGHTLDTLKDVNKAREVFMNGAKGFGKFLNPLENTVGFVANADKMDNISGLVKTYDGFASFYRDIRNIRLAHSEGSLEGGMVQEEMERSLYETFIKTHGRQPTAQEADNIRITAAQAGATTSFINAPVIMYSNKITFGSLMRTPKFLNADVITSNLGRKIAFSPRKGVKEAFKAIPEGFLKAKWHYIRNPKHLLKGVTTYSKENWSEGLQESMQEIISGTSKDYYTAKFQGDSTRGAYMNFIAENVGKQFTTEGAEVFLSGFLMGAVAGPVTKATAAVTQGKDGFRGTVAGEIGGFIRDKALQVKYRNNKGEYVRYKATEQEIKTKREQQLNEDINMLNDLYADPMKYFSPDLVNLLEQGEYAKIMELSEKIGDIKSYHDAKDSAGIKHILTALRYNRLDTFIERLEDMKNLSADDVATVKNPAEYYKILDTSIARAKRIQARWNLAQSRFKNPFTPKYGSRDYEETAVKKLAWDAALEEMVFNQASFDQMLERQENILNNAKNTSGLENVSYQDLNVLFTLKDAEQEITNLKREIAAFKDVTVTTPEAKKTLKEKETRLEKLSTLIDDIQKATITERKENESVTPENYQKLSKSFHDYIQHIAKQSGDYIQKDKLDLTLQSIIDFHLLKERSFAANNAVNVLLDPKNFLNYVERVAEIKRVLLENRKAEIRRSLEEYKKLVDKNALLNELFEAGMFFDPKDLAALEEEGKIPTTFYYVDPSGNWKEEVPMTSADYKKAISIIKKYVKDVMGINIPEHIGTPYYSFNRSKDPKDERTYADLAEQFGFDLEKDETQVLLADVLKAIIDSKYATTHDIALAEQLLKIADPKEFVTFSNNEKNPGTYSESRQSVIDARYNAHDYKFGKNGPPIETVILHEEIHRRTLESFKTDSVFRGQITNLYNKALETYKKLSPLAQQNLTAGKETFYGLSSVEEFVAEAMTNETFQKFLATIPATEAAGKSVWQKFVDAVLENILKLLNIKADGTVLNSALEIITAKINSTYSEVTQTPAGTTQSKGNLVTREISVNDLRNYHPELATTILQLFKAENQKRQAEGTDLLLKNADQMSDEEIYNSVAFKNYFAGAHWSKKESAITSYNKKLGLTAQPVTPLKVEEKKKPEIANNETVVRTLKSLGFIQNKISKNFILDGPDGNIHVQFNPDGTYTVFGFKYKKDEEGKYIAETFTNPTGTVVNLGFERDMKSKIQEETTEDNLLNVIEKVSNQVGAGFKKSAKVTPGMKLKTIPKVITEEMKKELVRLGYNRTEIGKMTRGEVYQIINDGLTKNERIAASTQKAEERDLLQRQTELRKSVEDMVNSAETIEDLEGVQAELLALFSENPDYRVVGKITADEIDQLIQNKFKAIALEMKYENLREGEIVILNDKYNNRARVVTVQNGVVVVEHLRKGNKLENITAEEVPEKIKYRWSKGMEQIELNDLPPVTDQDKRISEESMKSVEAPSEQIHNDVSSAETQDLNDIDDELENSICKK